MIIRIIKSLSDFDADISYRYSHVEKRKEKGYITYYMNGVHIASWKANKGWYVA